MNIQSIPLIEPQFFTDSKGNSIVMLTKDYYNGLLSRIEELQEDLEDIQALNQEKANPSEKEDAHSFFDRIDKKRKENGIG